MTPNTATIAIVEDDGGIRALLQEICAGEGWNSRTFADGEAALAVLLGAPPSLVITDLMMPRVDGMELVARLRGAHGPALPIIVLSAARASDVPSHLPVQAIIHKPFEVDRFIATVRTYFPAATALALGVASATPALTPGLAV